MEFGEDGGAVIVAEFANGEKGACREAVEDMPGACCGRQLRSEGNGGSVGCFH